MAIVLVRDEASIIMITKALQKLCTKLAVSKSESRSREQISVRNRLEYLAHLFIMFMATKLFLKFLNFCPGT